jgi:hypothetical protein
MSPTREVDLTQATPALAVANTPLFLLRKLRDDPAVQELGRRASNEELLDALRGSIQCEPTDLESAVRPYVYLVALFVKPGPTFPSEIGGIEAPHLTWFRYLRDYLLKTGSPVQIERIVVPNQLRAPRASIVDSSPVESRRINVGKHYSGGRPMKVLLLACSDSTAIDARLHTISLFHITEELNSASFPVAIPRLSVTMLLLRDPAEPSNADLNLRISLGDEVLHSGPLGFSFGDHLRCRWTAELYGLIVPAPGDLKVEVRDDLRALADWTVRVNHVGGVQVLQLPELPAVGAATVP